MAATNPGAKFKYNLAGRTSGILRTFIIDDSKTVTVGDFVIAGTTKFIGLATAGSNLLGVVVGIVDKNGINMDVSRYSLAQATWTSSTQVVVTGNANTTGDQISAIIDLDPFSVWSVEPDGAINTTSSSGKCGFLGSYVDLADEDEVDETNNSAAYNVKAQLFCWGLDPEDTTRGLYSIAQHQIWGV